MAKTFPLDMEYVLAHPHQCVVCRRKAPKTGTFIKVGADGNLTDDPCAYRVVVGPECREKVTQ